MITAIGLLTGAGVLAGFFVYLYFGGYWYMLREFEKCQKEE